MAGRLILLKAALDSTPIYWLSLYKLPVSVLNCIEKLRRQFLWGESSPAQRKLHLIGWERICKNKQDGGLGIAAIENRNSVLLAKWWWRAYSERGSLWNNFFVSCYGPKWNYDLGGLNPKDCSPIVRSFVSIKNEFQCTLVSDKAQFRWLCGNGLKVFFWEDTWLNDKALADRFPSLYDKTTTSFHTVSEVLKLLHSTPISSTLWLTQLLSDDQISLSSLLRLTEGVVLRDKNDQIVWAPSGGSYNTSQAYKILFSRMHSSSGQQGLWNVIWKLKTPPKVSIFIWKLNWEVLPTTYFLSSKIKDFSPLCPWCGQTNETLKHLFWDCVVATWAWQFIELWWSIKHSTLFKFGFCLLYILKLYKPKYVRQIWQIVVTACLWSIWLARNDLIFNKVKITKKGLQDLIFFRVSK